MSDKRRSSILSSRDHVKVKFDMEIQDVTNLPQRYYTNFQKKKNNNNNNNST